MNFKSLFLRYLNKRLRTNLDGNNMNKENTRQKSIISCNLSRKNESKVIKNVIKKSICSV
jgi:hypothetical protein